jgi:hypothetical protein
MDGLSPTQLMLFAMAVPLLIAGLVAWLLDPTLHAAAPSHTVEHESPDQRDASRPHRRCPAPDPSSPADQLPPSGA